MFKIGTTYNLKFRESSGREHTVMNCTVVNYDEVNGLLKVDQAGKEIIFMIRNITFHSAEIS